ncbi:DNA replication protein PSF3 KNAG_0K02640 [Huiozyma naganishii CBS 8797]|uniref:DNA replication complex GINS protein PSF3 n=1 Tax=Huiozyma naganishii (strain ATCC MYA-139 / BCRC 22969 / CBS 8797 / KCTC 17520 / NBRC 10181 / NCYC 3082 / Yp74L-3) TaxID=1071383 RepID=J7S3H5_HUIN7|nr:hypothetical protein KNAG_0K02640 [Kazachstania naganishii CBS 8797]CCK72627.1 hypothetical protein KNAG_0K02640 [Kazachstania naganishii CBS 8797]
MGYFDVDDVLADAVEVPCKFQLEVAQVGFLAGQPGESVARNSKLELPLWLARILAIVGAGDGEGDGDGDTPFVELLPPDTFAARVMNAVKADPVALDLHAVSPYFYALAVKWVNLFSDAELGETVARLLLARAQEINSNAANVTLVERTLDDLAGPLASRQNGVHHSSPFMLTMDEWEKTVYKEAHEAYRDSKKWLLQ